MVDAGRFRCESLDNANLIMTRLQKKNMKICRCSLRLRGWTQKATLNSMSQKQLILNKHFYSIYLFKVTRRKCFYRFLSNALDIHIIMKGFYCDFLFYYYSNKLICTYFTYYSIIYCVFSYESKTEFKNMFISCLHRNMHEHK